jgi:hypothetical protein
MGHLVLIVALAGCKSSPPAPPSSPIARDIAADFRACLKLEPLPDLTHHTEVTKCLVDRFHWPIAQADSAADSIIALFIDSVRLAEASAAAEAEAKRKLDLIVARRHDWERRVTNAQWIGDQQTMVVYKSWPSCGVTDSLNPAYSVRFKSSQEAVDSGYTISRYSGCYGPAPSFPGQ